MKKFSILLLLPFVFVFILSACGRNQDQATAGMLNDGEVLPAVTEATDLPLLTETVQPVLSFEPVTYRDETAGFELDYPQGWSLVADGQIGSRGSQVLLLSPGSTRETLADGGSRVTVLTYLWDPKNDLVAYTAQRKTAWDASGFVLKDEKTRELSDGRPVVEMLYETAEKTQVWFLLTTVGENYLQLAGEGDLSLVKEIFGTLRPTSK